MDLVQRRRPYMALLPYGASFAKKTTNPQGIYLFIAISLMQYGIIFSPKRIFQVWLKELKGFYKPMVLRWSGYPWESVLGMFIAWGHLRYIEGKESQII